MRGIKGPTAIIFILGLLFAVPRASGVAPEVLNLGEVVNSPYSDFAPMVSPDGNFLYFTSDREGGYGGQDVWVSERVDGQWTTPVNAGVAINGDMNQGPDFYYSDPETGEEYMFLTLCSGPEQGFCDIHRARRQTDGSWGEPENLGAPINTEYTDANASFDYVNKVLYFTSTRPGGVQGEGPKKLPDEASYDIWMCPLLDDGKWGEPKNLGEPINTPRWEGVAFYHAADNSLYFSSTGHGGMGGADIFRSRQLGPGKWSEPEPLDVINSSGHDMYLSIPASGEVAYFSSTASGGEGFEDIYVCPLYLLLEPEVLAARNILMPTRPAAADQVSPGHIETIYFDLESYFLNPSEVAKLDKVIKFMEEHPGVTIEIAGHACSMGDLDYNLILSKSRADAVFKYLLKKGVSQDRVEERFYGETRPAEPNDPIYGNPLNRRVEISIVE